MFNLIDKITLWRDNRWSKYYE